MSAPQLIYDSNDDEEDNYTDEDSEVEDEDTTQTPFQLACHLLQLATIPATMPCREKERSQVLIYLIIWINEQTMNTYLYKFQIYEFLSTAIERGSLGCALYISGRFMYIKGEEGRGLELGVFSSYFNYFL